MSTVSATENREFDNFGRLKTTAQITDGQTYTSGFTYNLSGALIQETYPSGRTVVNEFESDGDLARITSKKAAETVYHTYANDFLYTASGGISRMKLGNGKWETATFNTRLQVTQLGLGTSAADTSTWRINYEYGELNPDGSVDAAKNTGNIAKQTLSFGGLTYPMVQAFRYDALYRLTEAKETSNGSQSWIQNWTYDRYGNRATFTQNIGGNTNVWNPTVDTNTNRFVTNPSQGFGYDKNGNVVNDIDSITNHSRLFTFNGDNKQIEVRDTSTNLVKGQYFYDGEGKRVKKINPETNEVTVFVYSAGKLVAEYSTAAPASNPAVNFTTTDHLGSPRVITNELGHVNSRRDFLPFGEELYVNIGGRTTDQHYGSSTDNIRQKFTGYQKDTETSLDFAEARMYENRFGRFTAVDPLLTSGKSANPQTFDRYIYTSNNPVGRVDRNGLDWYEYLDTKVRANGTSFKVRMIYWWDKDPTNLEGRTRYAGPGVFREGWGRDAGRWTALDPYEGRSASFESRAEAVAQYQSYLRDRNINATRGLADAIASLGTADPLSEILYSWGADAVIGQPDANSNVYTVTNRTTNAMIIVGSVAGAGGGLRGVLATGQRHHLLSKKIMAALNKHDVLKGIFNRRDARFIYPAKDKAAHYGYDKWHRQVDETVVNWIERNPSATEDEFLNFLDDLYKQSPQKERIPNVNVRNP